ncbi:type IV pilus twitching motility protein PilT [Aceticella autotrophica]|uniref:Type IV pilus twitching motility protein PilT n=1 Tax=Aceticella autotrophica TaxID=2755338 RepID=A0A975AX14_9THEO|nr:type IV pilus twitching motility protein PilT [Aceticella autotrophica]QSZ28036.1 type IV pilus twitching motility protein PilT [Aceticella autotrophica]
MSDLKEDFPYKGENLVDDLLTLAVRCKASDLHITAGTYPVLRLHGRLRKLGDLLDSDSPEIKNEIEAVLTQWPELRDKVSPELANRIANLTLRNDRFIDDFNKRWNTDLAISVPGVSRFRVNVFRQRGNCAVAFRVLSNKAPNLDELFAHSPKTAEVLKGFAELPRGLILVTGPTGSGKSTTLAAMIDHISKTSERHIITLEDPIEYLYQHQKGVVNQREVGEDVLSFAEGLRAALREDPDVILVGEMRDLDTISTAISAAETGHLVLSTLHTITAAETVERIIDTFPPSQQQQIRVQLSGVLRGVSSQQLLPRKDGSGRVCAAEILVAVHAVRSLIRESKTHQIPTTIQTGSADGMVSMDKALADLVLYGLVSREEAEERVVEYKVFEKYLGMM